MNVLVVVSHPDSSSFTQAAAHAVAEGAGSDHCVEVADLVREGFDPRTTAEDLACYRGMASPPSDVQREQSRIDRADALVLVFPVYWWSFPALLKGWVDRVFTRDWAYSYASNGKVTPLLHDRPVHLVAVAAGDADGYEKHGYREAMRIQLEYGVFGFCGILRAHTAFLFDVENDDTSIREAYLAQCRHLGRTLRDA